MTYIVQTMRHAGITEVFRRVSEEHNILFVTPTTSSTTRFHEFEWNKTTSIIRNLPIFVKFFKQIVMDWKDFNLNLNF